MDAFKTVFEFDPDNFAFIGEYRAQLSPMEREERDENGVVTKEAVYITPVNSTDIPPPKVGKNEIPVFSVELKAWGKQPDFRGQIWYKPTGEDVLIDKIGMPDALPEMPLEEAKRRRMQALRPECVRAIVAGFDSKATGKKLLYPYELLDQQNLATAAVAAMHPNLPDDWSIALKCFDGKAWRRVPHTAEQIQIVLHVGIAHRDALSARMAELDAQIEAAKSVAEIESIVWESKT